MFLLAVQWNSDKGLNGWGVDVFKSISNKLRGVKEEFPQVSEEADKFFAKYQNNGKDLSKTINNVFTNNGGSNGIINWAKDVGVADESLIKFLQDTNYAEKNLANYQAYLKSAGQTTTAFASGVQKAGSVLKSLGATLASMAIMWGIGKLIELAITGIDNLIHKSEKAKEAMEQAFSDYDSAKEQSESTHEQLESVNSQIDALKAKGSLTFVEQDQLQTLRETSAELSKQADYYDRIADNKATEAMQSAVDVYKTDKTKYDLTTLPTSWGEIDRMSPVQLSGLLDDKNASRVANDYGNMLYIYRRALFEQHEAFKLGNNDLADQYEDVAKEYKQELSKALSDYQTQIMAIEKVPKNLWTEDIARVHDELQANIDILFPEIDPNGYGDYITNDILAQYDGLKEELIDLANVQNTSGLSVATLKDKYPDLANAITDAGYSVDAFVESINRQATASIEGKSNVQLMEEEFSAFQASSIDLINSLDNINAIENIKAAYQSLDGYDADILFEKTANGVTLNRKALRLLQAQQESIQKDKFQEKQRELTQKLTQAYKEQAAAIDQGKDGSEQLATINSLNAQLQSVNELSAAYDGATSAYQKWIDAQSGGEEGDMYDAITSTALERGKELYDKGLVGTEEFRAIADLFAYGDQSTASVEELVAAYENAAPIISQFFTEGQEGAMSFADKLVELGYASKDAEGAYLFNPADTLKIAEDLGIGVDAVEAVFRKIRDYGGDISFINTDDIEKLDQYKTKASEIQEQLKQLSNEKVDLSAATNFDIGELNTVDELQSKAEEINELILSPDVDATQLTWLQELVNIIQEKINVLNNSSASPSITLDSVQNAYATANSLINRIQEIDNINTTTTLDIDINGDTEVQSLAKQLAELPAEVKTSIGLEAKDDASAIIEKIKQDPGSITIPVQYQNVNDPDTSVGEKTKTVTVNEVKGTTVSIENETKEVTVNYSLGTQAEPSDKDASVNYDKGKQDAPDNKVAIVDYDRGMQQAPISPVTATVNYKLGTVASPPSATVKVNYDTSGKPSSANGTAHHLGTAPSIKGGSFSNGVLNVGAKRTEDALVGELGPELIVRNNRFFTVGDDGTEITHVQRGDIIFNHEQTKAILEKGYVTSRGKLIGGNPAFVEGNAYKTGVSGSWKPNPGGSGSKANSNSSSSSSSGSSNSINNATEAAEEFSETLDWIETAISRLEQSINRLSKFAEDAFDTFTNRNKNLISEISEVNREINLQQQAYSRYMQEANSVGLSEAWANKVRNGEINIEEITDEDLNGKIQEFQEWYEKALDCSDAIDDLRLNLKELYRQKFDNISTEFEGIIGQLEDANNLIEAYIDQTETRGHLVTASYYNTMINAEKSILSNLVSEKAALQKSLDDGVSSGQFAVGSEEFMDMKSAIDEVNKSIVESQTNIIEYGNSIRQLQWDVFDMIQDKISDINNEAEFLMDLLDANDLFDKNGKTTEHGAATFGLLGVKYNANMSLADQYAEEIKKLDVELSKDPYNQDLIERRQELLELQRDAISAAEDEKDAIKDLISDGIEAQLDALQDLIDKYTDMIDREQEAYEYQKKVSEQQEEISALEKQLVAYVGDDSEEGRLKRQETENQLKEARTNLEESQRDQQISETKKLLDDLYTSYEEILNMRLDNIDQLISDVIANVNSEASNIRDTITSEAASVGYTLTETMNTIWSDTGSIGTILSNYNNNFMTTMTTLQSAVDQIKVYIAGMVEDAKKESETTIGGTSGGSTQTPVPSPTPTPTPTPTPNSNSSSTDFFIYKYDSYWKDRLQPDVSIVDRLKLHNYDSSFDARAGYFEKMGLGSSSSYIGSSSQNLSMIRWMRTHGYARGKKRVSKSGLYATNEGAPETIITSDGAILTPLNVNDMVLNNKAHNVIWDFANDPTGFFQRFSSIPNVDMTVNGASQNINANINLEFNLPNVKNYEDFIADMQKDPKFEQWIQETTIGQALGHGAMRKTHIKF